MPPLFAKFLRISAWLMALSLVYPLCAQAQFVSLDRMREASLVGGRMDLSRFSNDDSLYLRTEVYAQYTTQLMGFYGQLAVSSWLAADDRALDAPDETASRLALGNLEVGGYMVQKDKGHHMIYRVGVVLPTARDNDGIGTFALMRNAWPRLTDHLLALPRVTALRLSASPYVRGGRVFFRADGGLDLALPSGEGFQVGLRGNMGVGMDLGVLIATAEFVNVMRMAHFPGPRVLHGLSLSAQHGIFHAAFTTGLGEDYDPWTFSLGIETAF